MMAVTSSQAHYLTFSGGGGQTAALLSDFALIATLSYSVRGLQLYSSTVVLFEDVPRIVNVSTAMYDAR
jgi:hypothetical protein